MSPSDFLADSVIGARIRTYDWTASSLGSIEAWPQALRNALGIILKCKFPSCLAWGPDLILLYNDACLPLLGAMPDALGKPFGQVWSELWEGLAPIVIGALERSTTSFDDLKLVLTRKGYSEETWWTFSCSPVANEDETGGVLLILCETTDRVLTERRLRFLVDFGNRLRGLSDPRQAMATAAEMLGRHLQASRVGYGEVNEAGKCLTVERDWAEGATPSFTGRYDIEVLDLAILAELKAGHVVRIEDAAGDPRISGDQIAAAFLTACKRATIIAPLVKDGRLAAGLFVHSAKPRHWRDDELILAQEVAERIWEAVSRARAEADVRENEERFRQFAEHTTNVLWIADAETMQLEYLNPAYERVWGEPADAARDVEHWMETVHPDDKPRAAEAMKRVLQGEVVFAQEYRIVRPDGSVRWIQDTFFPIRDEHGQVRRAGGVAQDITRHSGSLVYVVDSDDASRESLTNLMLGAGYDATVFTGARSFLDVAPALLAGCVVLVVRIPDSDLPIMRNLKARRSNLPTIAVGESHGDIGLPIKALKAGAVDWVETPYKPEVLLRAVASALADIHESEDQDLAAAQASSTIAALSERERQVLGGLVAGGSNKTIGRDLGISPRTVEAYRKQVMEKLGAQNLPEVIRLALAAGVKPGPPPT